MPKRTRKFAIYNTLQAALRRAGFEKTGALATVFLETFIERDGLLTANDVMAAGLCAKDGFKAWREPLIKAGWLAYDHEFAKLMKKGSLHQPGKKLLSYINKERPRHDAVATEKQLRSVQSDVSAVKDEVALMTSFLRRLIDRVDPPWSEEKMQSYLQDPDSLFDSMIDRAKEVSDLEDRLNSYWVGDDLGSKVALKS